MDFFEADVGISFEWDLGNRTKNFIKHGITVEEAESVFSEIEAIRALGEQVSPKVRTKIWDSGRHKRAEACVRVLHV